MIALIILSVFIPQFLCESVVLLDLTPAEAQELIAGRSLAVNYARKIDEGLLSASPDRGNRKFYHNGQVIDNPSDYVQRTYEANQFHAQDGLGRSMFGYSDWNQGRLEARNANGEVRGSYQYVDPYGEDVVVNYWSDRLGFHQMDNRPKFVMNPVTETPEVKAAREAHEKAWAAAAAAARVNPDPMSDIYNANSNKLDEEQSEADQAMEIKQGLSRYPNLAHTNQIQEEEEEDEEGAFSHDSVVVKSTGEARNSKQLGKIRIENEEEEPSNPRGFFYSFDYPVQLILANSDDRQQRSVSAEKDTSKSTKTDIGNLNTPLEAEVADYKIVKRRENSKDAGHISEKVIEKADTATIVGKNSNSESQDNLKKADEVTEIEKENPKASSSSTHPNSKATEAQIPVYVKVESSDSLQKSEMELRRLATNAEVIDAVHDVQVHRHVQA